jgi:hypothetical protein
MAVPTISLELVEHFSPLILFILVFAIIYALFQSAKILGDNKILHSIIAIMTSLMITVFSPGAREVVKYIIPWFTVLAIIMVFAIMLWKMFGITDSDVKATIMKRTDIQWTLFIVVVILVLGALSQAYGQGQLELSDPSINDSTTTQNSNLGEINMGNPGTTDTSSGSFNQNLGATIYHPKILGAILLFIIAALAIATLTKPVFKG